MTVDLDVLEQLSLATRETIQCFISVNGTDYPYMHVDDLRNACGSASLVLTEVLSHMSFTNHVTIQQFHYPDEDGGCHCWVRLNHCYFVDITATQFGGPSVYISDEVPFIFDKDLSGAVVETYLPHHIIGTGGLRGEMMEDGWPDNELFRTAEVARLVEDSIEQYGYMLDMEIMSLVA